ncbi:MAG: OmpA family protein [Bacteroidales bacterium]|jgi:outer membrane protein OmpA-like peptidoglycan-associated protein|nr:OmpA family protein [Bacteroidales bacterium]
MLIKALKTLVSLVSFLLFTLTIEAQSTANLVYNPSFEEHLACPDKIEPYGKMMEVIAWWQPTNGSADYYNKCGGKQTSIPKNKLGIQMPHYGVAMVGIYASKTTYREYIQTELKEKLIKGERYKLSFYVSLSEYSSAAVATIGGLLTTNRIEDTTREILAYNERTMHKFDVKEKKTTYFKPQVVNAFDNPITNTQDWTKIEGEFIAEGGELYLTIGNFYPAEKSNLIEPKNLTYLLPGAYYYIDDVSLTCLTCGIPKHIVTTAQNSSSEITITTTKDEKNYEVGQVIVLENIFFDFDKSVLLPQSYVELKHLIDLLSQYPNMKIELSGHTDSYGTDAYNQPLSERRAMAVCNYLLANKINPTRLTHSGFGSKRPIATNETDEGRAKNRRVEFKIIEM